MNLTVLNTAFDAALAAAISQAPVSRVPSALAGDPDQTVRVDVYTGPKGSGFAVVASLKAYGTTFLRVQQHGPETWRDRNDITADKLLAACRVAREKEYPPMADYLDAQVKKASQDATVQAAGAAQEATYLAACLAVKAKYPKPE